MRTLLSLCLIAPSLCSNLVRADALLVARGLCGNRAAAKAAISAGYVTTKSGAPVSKASKPLAADAALFLRVPGADGAGTGAASGATFAAAPSEESQRPQGGRTVLTPSGEAFLASAALQHKLGEAVVPVRRRSAASRASVFQHRKRSGGEKRAGGEST